MKHTSNARADRYPVRREITTDAHQVSTNASPFCEINDDGECEAQWHTHAGPVKLPLWAHLSRIRPYAPERVL